MPITPSISVAQSPLNPAIVTVTDTSSGSDGAIFARRIFFQTPQGTYLVTSGTTTSYVLWPYADASMSFNILPQDYGLSITVLWVNVGGTTLYTYNQVYPLAEYNKQYFYYLAQQQALTYSIIGTQPYFANMATFWANVVGGINAVTTGADIDAAQACFDRATFMRTNETEFFQN